MKITENPATLLKKKPQADYRRTTPMTWNFCAIKLQMTKLPLFRDTCLPRQLSLFIQPCPPLINMLGNCRSRPRLRTDQQTMLSDISTLSGIQETASYFEQPENNPTIPFCAKQSRLVQHETDIFRDLTKNKVKTLREVDAPTARQSLISHPGMFVCASFQTSSHQKGKAFFSGPQR